MAAQIAAPNIGGSLEVTDDGEVIFTKTDKSKAEVLTVDQAIARWPQLAQTLRGALKDLPRQAGA